MDLQCGLCCYAHRVSSREHCIQHLGESTNESTSLCLDRCAPLTRCSASSPKQLSLYDGKNFSSSWCQSLVKKQGYQFDCTCKLRFLLMLYHLFSISHQGWKCRNEGQRLITMLFMRVMISCVVMIQSLELCLSVKDTTVVSGRGLRLAVCSAQGLGQQLLHVEGTLTAISRTEATNVPSRYLQIALSTIQFSEVLCYICATPVVTLYNAIQNVYI